jgi:uncharacterized damage-inducible protein DinB
MRNHLLQLLEYDNWANSIVLDLVKENTVQNERIIIILNHIFEAERLWLARMREEDYHARIFTTAPLNEIEKLKAEAYHLWKEFLVELKDEDMDEVYAYKNIRGDAYSNKLKDVLTHVFNHSEHHRSEIITLLKAEHPGIHIPPTDYIFYLR